MKNILSRTHVSKKVISWASKELIQIERYKMQQDNQNH
jgi:hypothetical protein